jgi:hypothetical protein
MTSIKIVEADKEPSRITAIFRLPKGDYPELEDATIVITEEADNCIVGVKGLGCLPDGRQTWFGDLCRVSKDEPISKLFDSLGAMFKNVENLINENDKGVKA